MENVIDGQLYLELIKGGSENMRRHAAEVDDLNVFPIPDGDTGENMLLTMLGGAKAEAADGDGIDAVSKKVADGMLLAARGNSGVILSQFFDGIAAGLKDVKAADVKALGTAFLKGVERAYSAVMTPTEGTILTVAREASDHAASRPLKTPSEFFCEFLTQARFSLEHTPELLPVLKKAGVVDSGGAGLIYIIEGMSGIINGDIAPVVIETGTETMKQQPDFDMFTEDSSLEFGYCTEIMLRLQSAKTDVASFDVDVIRDFLKTAGESIVAFKTGSIVKIHVHTMTPYKVLEFCQRYGEYLAVKIENMSLQHNSLPAGTPVKPQQERKKYGVVAVASGEGIKDTLRDMGADVIVDGGQSMNPSSDDFISAFKKVNADTVLVLPNNGNVILAAKQAASLYNDSDVRIIESRTVGDGYAALTMLNTDSGDTERIVSELTDAMEGVITAYVSRCSRDTETDGFMLKKGEYIGFYDDTVISADCDRRDAAFMLADRLDFSDHEVCILIRGTDSDAEEAEEIENYITSVHPDCEVYLIEGGQDIFSYIMIVE